MNSQDPTESTSPGRRRPSATASFGDELRRERELRGISLQEIAEATKVSLRFLEAMERNEFDSIPGGLFTRGFIRAYATHIGADPEKLVNAYLFQVAQEEEKAVRELGPRPVNREEERRAPRRRWIWGLWALLGALLLWGLFYLVLSATAGAP